MFFTDSFFQFLYCQKIQTETASTELIRITLLYNKAACKMLMELTLEVSILFSIKFEIFLIGHKYFHVLQTLKLNSSDWKTDKTTVRIL